MPENWPLILLVVALCLAVVWPLGEWLVARRKRS